MARRAVLLTGLWRLRRQLDQGDSGPTLSARGPSTDPFMLHIYDALAEKRRM